MMITAKPLRYLLGLLFSMLSIFFMGIKELRIQWLEEQERVLSIRTIQHQENRKSDRAAALSPSIVTTPTISGMDLDPDDTHMRLHHAELIRPRPTNLQIVFLGDSVTRYQYLSLAYYLRHGRWWDPSIRHVNNLVNAHSFHHPLHPDDDWNEFFLQSNRLLHPMEACDCWRSQNQENIILERRYFYDETRNNRIVYINMNPDAQGRGYYGRLQPEQTFTKEFSQIVGLPFGMNVQQQSNNERYDEAIDENRDSSLHHQDEKSYRKHHPTDIQWEYETWSQVLREHIGRINFSPDRITAAVLNAGIHPHDFDNPETQEDVAQALQDLSFLAIWKTTSFSKHEIQEIQQQHDNIQLPIRTSDIDMCRILGHCHNISWTTQLRPEFYFDNLHFLEPVYRVFNEDLLESLGALPNHYQKLNRTTILLG
jgi:hypothetical protein